MLNVWVFNLKLKRFEHQGLVNLAESNVVLGMREGGVLARLVEDWEGRVYDGFRRSSGVAQVWSLIQFYSVTFKQSKIIV